MNEVDSEGLARKRSSEHLSGWASKSKTGTSKSMHDNDCTETMREQISGRECKKTTFLEERSAYYSGCAQSVGSFRFDRVARH